MNNDSLYTVLTYLDVADLLTVRHVSKRWRRLALYRLDTLPSLRIRDVLDRCSFEQADVEDLISLCSRNLTQLDLTLDALSDFKFHNLSTLFLSVGECGVLEHLLFSQYHEAPVPSFTHVTLPSSLKSLQIDGQMYEPTLTCLTKGLKDLSSLTMKGNNRLTGCSLVQITTISSLKDLHIDNCNSISPESLHDTLKNSSTTLTTLTFTNFGDENCLNFDSSDMSSFRSMQTLKISNPTGIKFTSTFPLIGKMPYLTSLTLQNCPDLDGEPFKIALLPRLCPLLEYLDLSRCGLASMLHLTPLIRLKKLATLGLNELVMMDRGSNIDYLLYDVISRISTLKSLTLEDPTGFSIKDEHISMLINMPLLNEMRIFFSNTVDGSFIEQCENLERANPIDIYFYVSSGPLTSDLYENSYDGLPSFMNVSVEFDDFNF